MTGANGASNHRQSPWHRNKRRTSLGPGSGWLQPGETCDHPTHFTSAAPREKIGTTREKDQAKERPRLNSFARAAAAERMIAEPAGDPRIIQDALGVVPLGPISSNPGTRRFRSWTVGSDMCNMHHQDRLCTGLLYGEPHLRISCG